ncbi:MAG: DNA polymerase Y family protein [Paracoccaceae bacterium]
MEKRILSLHFPRLSSDLVLRRLRGAAGALAIVVRRGRGDVLACLTATAEAQGLRRGQSLTEARILLPGLVTRPHDPRPPARALRALRRWVLRYAPWAAIDGEDGLIVDLTGSAHLHGGEEALCADLLSRLRAMGFGVRLAIAPTRGAAWGLARFTAGPITLAVDAAAAIDTLPIAALRLPEEICAGLSRLGLRQVRDLGRAQRAPLVRRFGEVLALRLDQATGALAEPVAAPPDTVHHAIRLSLPEPIGLTTDVRAALVRLLEALCARLASTDQGARQLRFELQRTDNSVALAEIALARPMRDPAAMAALFERTLEALDAGFGFDLLRLSAPLTEAMPPAQIEQGGATGADALADLMTRLGNRVGLDALTRFVPAESHIPEQAFQIVSAVHGPRPSAQAWGRGADRPLTLFPPEPLPGAGGSHPPERFVWRRRRLTLLRATGPERLTPEWWMDSPGWRSGLRDYWRLDTVEGPRLWAFFTPQDPGWAVQGEFA